MVPGVDEDLGVEEEEEEEAAEEVVPETELGATEDGEIEHQEEVSLHFRNSYLYNIFIEGKKKNGRPSSGLFVSSLFIHVTYQFDSEPNYLRMLLLPILFVFE